MRISLLMIPVLFLHGFTWGVTLRDRFERQNIAINELAPALRNVIQQNDSKAAISVAVAIKDLSSVHAILFPCSRDYSLMVEDLKIAAVTAVQHGYNIMICSDPLRAAYQWSSAYVYDEAFWTAVKMGYFEVAMSIVDVVQRRWNPLESFASKRHVDQEMITGLIAIFPELIQYSVDKIEQSGHPAYTQSIFRSHLEFFYGPALALVDDPEMHAQLKDLLITAYILVESSEIFSQSGGVMSQLKVEAQTRIFRSMGRVSEHVRVSDVMGVIAEHVDRKNGRWLKILSEYTG